MSRTTVFITDHAAQRFCERVHPCSLEEARAEIRQSQHAIEVAADFGCSVIRLGCGARLMLDRMTVVTVYPAHEKPRQLRNRYIGDVE